MEREYKLRHGAEPCRRDPPLLLVLLALLHEEDRGDAPEQPIQGRGQQ
jgi:hypothetical protein